MLTSFRKVAACGQVEGARGMGALYQPPGVLEPRADLGVEVVEARDRAEV
jgi:hypothetical protein